MGPATPPPLSEVPASERASGLSLALRSELRRRATVSALGSRDPTAANGTLVEERSAATRRRSRGSLPKVMHAVHSVSKLTNASSAPRAASSGASSAPPAQPARCDPRFEFFQAGLAGARSHMEDRTLVVPELAGGQGAAVFGVFDGHGGSEVADLAVELLPKFLGEALEKKKEPHVALQQSFVQCDQAIRRAGASHPSGFERVGCTATIVLAVRRFGRLRLLCANCGDSRAVLSRGGVAMDLSHDHKPQDPAERRRIEAAGGQVILYETAGRVDGCLAVSRGLGDFIYKAREDLPCDKQKVIAVPEIKEIPVGKCDDFVAVGTDGVFMHLSSEELIGQLGAARRRGKSWDTAVGDVLEHTKASGDNVSLCIAHFLH